MDFLPVIWIYYLPFRALPSARVFRCVFFPKKDAAVPANAGMAVNKVRRSAAGFTAHGNHSLIYLGRGENHIWTYGMNYSFGVAGGCFGLSVYGKQFKSRKDALTFALNELKIMMTKKIGSTDTTNDKQPVILATLRAIEPAQVNMVQLTLF